MIAQLDAEYIRSRPLKALTRIVSWGLFEGRPVTTRGRWINPLVFAWLAAARRLPFRRAVRAPVYIIGTGRSGTTILGKVLSLHPAVGFLNEPKAMWHAAVPGEDVIGNYDRGPARFRLDRADAPGEVVRAVRRLFGAYLLATGADRLVDKYPELVFRVPFVREIFPDARFLFLVRDGWDTIRSIDRWSDRLGVRAAGEIHDWWGVDDRKWRLLVDEVVAGDPDLGPSVDHIRALGSDRDRAAVEWIVTMREGLGWRDELPDAVRLVRYEDLVTTPVETVAALLQHCDLEPDDVTLRYAAGNLAPVARRSPVELDPSVEPAFLSVMERLGYGRKSHGDHRATGPRDRDPGPDRRRRGPDDAG